MQAKKKRLSGKEKKCTSANQNSNKTQILGFKNIFGVSKVSQPPESKFSIIKIDICCRSLCIKGLLH